MTGMDNSLSIICFYHHGSFLSWHLYCHSECVCTMKLCQTFIFKEKSNLCVVLELNKEGQLVKSYL